MLDRNFSGIRFTLLALLVPTTTFAGACPDFTKTNPNFGTELDHFVHAELKDHKEDLLVVRVDANKPARSEALHVTLPIDPNAVDESKKKTDANKFAFPAALLKFIQERKPGEQFLVYHQSHTGAVFSSRSRNEFAGKFDAKKECPLLQTENRVVDMAEGEETKCNSLNLGGMTKGTILYDTLARHCQILTQHKGESLDRMTDTDADVVKTALNSFKREFGEPPNRSPGFSEATGVTTKRKYKVGESAPIKTVEDAHQTGGKTKVKTKTAGALTDKSD